MPTIYLDMDGVVADFDGYASKVLGLPVPEGRWPKEHWNDIIQNPRIYSLLEKTKEADALVEYCRYLRDVHGWQLIFLTAVPKDNDVHWAFYDKVFWAQKYFPDIPVHFGPFAKNKQDHCYPSDILIDDKPSNITEWKDAGGYGILHVTNKLEPTICELNKVFCVD